MGYMRDQLVRMGRIVVHLITFHVLLPALESSTPSQEAPDGSQQGLSTKTLCGMIKNRERWDPEKGRRIIQLTTKPNRF
jgi:hypothetical protein